MCRIQSFFIFPIWRKTYIEALMKLFYVRKPLRVFEKRIPKTYPGQNSLPNNDFFRRKFSSWKSRYLVTEKIPIHEKIDNFYFFAYMSSRSVVSKVSLFFPYEEKYTLRLGEVLMKFFYVWKPLRVFEKKNPYPWETSLTLFFC